MMPQTLLPFGLIICTRNRAIELRTLLNAIVEMKQVPCKIVVVDSSGENVSKEIRRICETSDLRNLHYIHTEYGAPHQKNVGLEYLASSDLYTLEAVGFMDDDIIPNPEYFEATLELLKKNNQIFCIGGFDRNLNRPKVSALRLALGIDARGPNRLLQNGLSTAGIPSSELEYCDWVPGGMQSFKRQAVERNRFDGTIRIHGDEVEFQLRLEAQGFGRIATSNRLGVTHTGSTAGKTDIRTSTGYLDGFRWRLSQEHPERFKPSSVLWATLVLALGEVIRWTVSQNQEHLKCAMGHLDFIIRLVRRRETLEKVSHAGSGPFAKENRGAK
jgi:GT2 family glycosyltransferase